MDFTYVASGGISIIGCSNYELDYYRYYKYSIGSIVFNKHKALKGIYEKVVIKKVKFPTGYVNLYIDTFNAHWNEDELVSYNTATALIKNYIDTRNANIENLVRTCKI